MNQKYLLLIVLSILIVSTVSITPSKMTIAQLQKIKQQQDYIHHILFFNEQTFRKFNQQYSTQLEQMSKEKDIKFYFHDCKSAPMQQCQNSEKVPVVLLFNRIFIRFNGGQGENQSQEIYDWIITRIAASPVLIQTKDELTQVLNKAKQLFCYCQKEAQQKALFYSLNKALIVTNYCILQNKTLYEQLGLQAGNITLFKNSSLQNRTQYQHPNRYDAWEMFAKTNAINHVKRSEELIQKRFAQEDKNIDTVVVICDLSYKCENFWLDFQEWSHQFKKQHPNIDLRFSFFDQKQNLMFSIYLHTQVNISHFPALLNVKLLSQNQKAGWIRRYVNYPQKLDSKAIVDFINNVNDGNVSQVRLSGPTPKNNGFTGKHSEKLIQKVTASTLNETIAQSKKHYVLLLSSFGIGCHECQQFYKEYKKAASLLSQQDITFGYMDVLKNQVMIDNVQMIPQVLLYNKYIKNDPDVMRGRSSFDGLLRFLESNAIVNYSSGNEL